MSMIIEHFGEFLHKEINKPVIACKGIFRLAIKDVFGDNSLKSITYEQMRDIIEKGIRTRLEKLNIDDIDNIVKKLQDERKKTKPIFKISNI